MSTSGVNTEATSSWEWSFGVCEHFQSDLVASIYEPPNKQFERTHCPPLPFAAANTRGPQVPLNIVLGGYE